MQSRGGCDLPYVLTESLQLLQWRGRWEVVVVISTVHQVRSVLIIVLLFLDSLESGMAGDLLWSMEHEQ